MKIKKKHIVIAALIVALGAAVYLNWQFADTSSLLKPTSKELGAATYVSTDTVSSDNEAQRTAQNVDQTSQYFAKAESERKQAQDKALSEAKEALKLTDADDDLKEKALEQLNQLENNIVAQSNIESTLKAKGFSRCLCFISEDGCSVAVPKTEIKDNAALIIKDAVLSQTDMEFNDITIIEV